MSLSPLSWREGRGGGDGPSFSLADGRRFPHGFLSMVLRPLLDRVLGESGHDPLPAPRLDLLAVREGDMALRMAERTFFILWEIGLCSS